MDHLITIVLVAVIAVLYAICLKGPKIEEIKPYEIDLDNRMYHNSDNIELQARFYNNQEKMRPRTNFSQLINHHAEYLKRERGIHNVQMIRKWRSRNGLNRKAYELFVKNGGHEITKRDLMEMVWHRLETYLEMKRQEVSSMNKSPKPKWIHQ